MAAWRTVDSSLVEMKPSSPSYFAQAGTLCSLVQRFRTPQPIATFPHAHSLILDHPPKHQLFPKTRVAVFSPTSSFLALIVDFILFVVPVRILRWRFPVLFQNFGILAFFGRGVDLTNKNRFFPLPLRCRNLLLCHAKRLHGKWTGPQKRAAKNLSTHHYKAAITSGKRSKSSRPLLLKKRKSQKLNTPPHRIMNGPMEV